MHKPHPTLAASLSALEAAKAEEKVFADRHSEAELATIAAAKALDASLAHIGAAGLRSRDAIVTFVGGDPGKAKEPLAALRKMELAARQEERADRAWQPKVRAVDKAANNLLKASVESRAEAVRRAHAFLEANHCRITRPGIMSVGGDYEAPALALAVLLNDLACLPEPTPPVGRAEPPAAVRQAWEAALGQFEAAKRAYRRAEEEWTRTHIAYLTLAPHELLVTRSCDQHVMERWTRLEGLSSDASISDEERTRLTPLLIEWRERYQSLPEYQIHVSANERMEAAMDAMWEAEKALLATPAPDVAVLMAKMQHIEADIHDEWSSTQPDRPRGFLSKAWIAVLADGYGEARSRLLQFQDAARLAGSFDHPALQPITLQPFSWIAAYEAAGGVVTAATSATTIYEPVGPKDAAYAERQRLLGQIAEEWQRHAIQLAAEQNREEGSDLHRHSILGQEAARSEVRAKSPLKRGEWREVLVIQPPPVVLRVGVHIGLTADDVRAAGGCVGRDDVRARWLAGGGGQAAEDGRDNGLRAPTEAMQDARTVPGQKSSFAAEPVH